MNPKQKHLPYLDGIRGLSALYVTLGHAVLTVWPLAKQPGGLTKLLLAPMMLGHYAVVVFIVLSGYCLALPIVQSESGQPRSGWLHFFQRRFWRIVPPYWCAMAVTLALIGTVLGKETGSHWDMCVPVQPLAIPVYALLLNDVLAAKYGGQINHVYWSIPVEWHLYFLFPALLFLRRKFRPEAMLAGALAVGYAAWLVLRKSDYSGLMPHMLPLFALGAFGAGITHGPAQAWHQRVPWGALGVLTALLAVVGGLKLGIEAMLVRAPFLDPLIGVATVALLVVLPKSQPLQKLLGGKLPVFLGVMGYSLYLMHAPLLQLVWQYALNPLQLAPVPTFGLLMLSLPLVIGLCYLFFLACEKPFLKKRG